MKGSHPGGFRGISMGGKPSGKGTQPISGHGGHGSRSAHSGPCGTKVSPHSTVQGCKEHQANIGTHNPSKATRERGSY